LSIAQKQIAPTTTIIKTPIKTEIIAPSLCYRSSFRFRLQPQLAPAINKPSCFSFPKRVGREGAGSRWRPY
jgi:hypothetical protein